MEPNPKRDPNMNPNEDPKAAKMKKIIFCVFMILYGTVMLILSTFQIQLHPVLLFILSLIPVIIGIVMLVIVIRRN